MYVCTPMYPYVPYVCMLCSVPYVCMYVYEDCMYVYEDSNFEFFRIPHVYVYANKWLEHQILGKSLPVSNFTCY